MDFNTLALECAPWVAPQTMAAIVKTESQFNPLAINVNGRAKLTRQPSTKEEAIATAKWLIANKYNIDIGLGQINSANLAKTNLTVEEAFEPCKNLAAAAKILQSNYQAASRRIHSEQHALQAAISAYNTGSMTRGFHNGYVQKVLHHAGAGEASRLKSTAMQGAEKAKTKTAVTSVSSKKRMSGHGGFVMIPTHTSSENEVASAAPHGHVVFF